MYIAMASTSPSPPSALQTFIIALPVILHHCPHTTLSVLLHLVDLDASQQVEAKSVVDCNPLFEPDLPNNYAEEVVVLTAVSWAFNILIASHYEALHRCLVTLARQVQHVMLSHITLSSNISCNLSPWDKPHVYLGLCKVALISEAVVDGIVKADQLVTNDLSELLTDWIKIKSSLIIN